MPYEGEFASVDGYVDILQSDFIKERLKTISPVKKNDDKEAADIMPVRSAQSLGKGTEISYVVSMDGSVCPVNVDSMEFAATKVAVVTESFKALAFISENPESITQKRLDDCYRKYTLSAMLTGRGVYDSELDLSSEAKCAYEVYQAFYNLRIRKGNTASTEEHMSLLETLLRVITTNPGQQHGLVRCRTPRCGGSVAVGINPTPCSECGRTVYLTDYLKLSDRFTTTGSNEPIFNETMLAMEKIAMAGVILKDLELHRETASRTAYITDGPLSFFRSDEAGGDMLNFLQSLDSQPVLFGIEKTGQAERFAFSKRVQDRLGLGDIAMIDDKTTLAFTGSTYSGNRFYGRRFIYRTTLDKTFVFTVPPVRGEPHGESGEFNSTRSTVENWDDYPTLPAIISVLERTQTDMYGANVPALSSVVEAHKACSIPRETGGREVKNLLQREIGHSI